MYYLFHIIEKSGSKIKAYWWKILNSQFKELKTKKKVQNFKFNKEMTNLKKISNREAKKKKRKTKRNINIIEMMIKTEAKANKRKK